MVEIGRAFQIASLLVPACVFAADFSGPVISVLDADTIEALNCHHAERIRFSGIDCPEKGQAFGKRAKQAASELVFDKKVTIQTHGHDKYKRTLGDVILLEGTNVNHTLVKESWFWWYRKYAPGDTVSSLGPVSDRTRRARQVGVDALGAEGKVKATMRSPGGTAAVYP